MRKQLLTSLSTLLMLVFLFPVAIQAQGATALEKNSTSHILIKVHNMNLNTYNQLANAVAREADLTLEYGCVEFGIVAFKLKHSQLSDADVKTYILSRIRNSTANKSVEIIRVETRQISASRC